MKSLLARLICIVGFIYVLWVIVGAYAASVAPGIGQNLAALAEIMK